MSTDLTYFGLVTGHADGEGPRLQVTTPSGRVREIPLTRRQLTRIISRAADALEVLDRAQEDPSDAQNGP